MGENMQSGACRTFTKSVLLFFIKPTSGHTHSNSNPHLSPPFSYMHHTQVSRLQLKKSMWVRMKTGAFKGDLGLIVGIADQVKLEIFL